MPRNTSTSTSVMDRLAMVLATGFGTGYAPIAPGTWGSLPGLLAAWACGRWGGGWGVAGGAACFAAAGVWAADRASTAFGSKDPRQVVVDEIAGQMVTLAFLPLSPRVLAVGFILFRFLDVWKPWPADRLEALPGGSGIMADDLMAGLYANLLLQVVVAWRPGWLGLA